MSTYLLVPITKDVERVRCKAVLQLRTETHQRQHRLYLGNVCGGITPQRRGGMLIGNWKTRRIFLCSIPIVFRERERRFATVSAVDTQQPGDVDDCGTFGLGDGERSSASHPYRTPPSAACNTRSSFGNGNCTCSSRNVVGSTVAANFSTRRSMHSWTTTSGALAPAVIRTVS